VSKALPKASKPFAFVLMPFKPEFDDVYKLGIQAAAEEAGVEAKRLDEQLFDGGMLEQIYAEIDRAELIIAEMSTRNENVFYEAGYADAKKKLIIFLTKDPADIPFDLKQRPHIVYGSIGKLKEELAKRLAWAAQEVVRRREIPIRIDAKIVDPEFIRAEEADSVRARFRIELHNGSDSTVTGVHSIYLFTNPAWRFSFHGKECTHTDEKDGSARHIITPDFTTVPARDWRPLDVIGERTIWRSWDKPEQRKDEYEVAGRFRVHVLTQKLEIKHEQQVSARFTYDDIPF